ncbi:hypothetical protein PTKIN_Ptkin15bG0135600 [Pterospermum kingtungense]
MASHSGVIYNSRYCTHSPSEPIKPHMRSHPKLVSLKKWSNLNKPRFLLRAKTSNNADGGTGGCCDAQEFLKNRRDYKCHVSDDIKYFSIPKGLSEETIRLISSIRKEPAWVLEFRLSCFRKFLTMKEPKWSDNQYPPIDLQDICYYSQPDPTQQQRLLRDFDRICDPLNAAGAFDVIVNSVSISTKKRKELEEAGVIFCTMSEAIRKHPDLVRKYLGKVVPPADNYYAALNSAVFSEGNFAYIPKYTKCPSSVGSFFWIQKHGTGQFERTLIIAEEGSFVEYMELCTAEETKQHQLHAAVVELYCAEGAEISYSTVQNWQTGDKEGKGGVYNFVTKRGLCAGRGSKISWTQVETGSAITWKYPSVVLEGDESVGEFYSVAVTKGCQQADTGSKMIHKGKNTRSRIISKGISSENSRNCYRGLVQVLSKADKARNSSQCDSMLVGDNASANTYPYIEVKNPSARVEHEAKTSKIGEDKIFYFRQRGIDPEQAMAAMISGYCEEVFSRLPYETSHETKKVLNLRFDKPVG